MSHPKIPSITEIQAASEFLNAPDASAKVVRIGPNIAVKFGPGVSLIEGQSQKFIADNTKIPVPKVFDMFTDPDSSVSYIVMEYVAGQTLEKLWESLSSAEKLDISGQLQTALEELRSLPPPHFIGSVGHQALADGVFWEPEGNPLVSGPFRDEAEMNEGMLRRLGSTFTSTNHSYIARSSRCLHTW